MVICRWQNFHFLSGAFSFSNFNTMTICCFIIRKPNKYYLKNQQFQLQETHTAFICNFCKFSVTIVTVLFCLDSQNKYHILSVSNSRNLFFICSRGRDVQDQGAGLFSLTIDLFPVCGQPLSCERREICFPLLTRPQILLD